SQPTAPTTDFISSNNLDEIPIVGQAPSAWRIRFAVNPEHNSDERTLGKITHPRTIFDLQAPAKMCETVVVRHRCGHEDIMKTSACCKEPKSFYDKNGERVAGLKGLPAPLPWCSFQSNLPVRSIRLCPDCRKQRRKEARESRPFCEDWQKAWCWWKDWTSSEDEGKRGRRRQEEAERLERLERRLSEMADGW
ncbi:hypothetical protein N431DRAFT_328997, partial [Stipitochalara longipes BDJ]